MDEVPKDQERQNVFGPEDDFDQIVVEDAASEPGGCLGLIAVAAITAALIIVGWTPTSSTSLAAITDGDLCHYGVSTD